MSEEEITSMLQKLAKDIRSIAESLPADEAAAETVSSAGIDPAKAIKEKVIICVECGQTFKLLTKKHLSLHGLTPAEYRARCGYKKTTALVCKSLQRERRKKMRDMKLWERRRGAAAAAS